MDNHFYANDRVFDLSKEGLDNNPEALFCFSLTETDRDLWWNPAAITRVVQMSASHATIADFTKDCFRAIEEAVQRNKLQRNKLQYTIIAPFVCHFLLSNGPGFVLVECSQMSNRLHVSIGENENDSFGEIIRQMRNFKA